MAISKTDHIRTYDDYMQMEDDGKRYEVLDGELIEMPGLTLRHQDIAGRIFRNLYEYAEQNGLGSVYIAPIDVVLSPIDVVQPDVLFVSRENAVLLANGMNVQGPPDLCVEVLSRGTSEYDRGRKRELYARFGVTEYWIVDPEAETIMVLVLREGAYARLGEAAGDEPVSSIVLPGFAVTARTFFPTLPV